MRGFDFFSEPIDGGTFLLLVVLYFLGAKLVHGNQKLQLLSKRFALGSFFLFVWMLYVEWKPTSAEDWAGILIRALVLSGVVLGVSWTILPPLAFAWAQTIAPALRVFRSSRDALTTRTTQQRLERERLEKQCSAESERQRLAPELERQRQESQIQAAKDAELQAEAQKRREECRLRCELLYERNSRPLATAFPRDRFEQFLARYMHDGLAAESVEQREELLKETIRETLGTSDSQTPKFRTVSEIAAHFEARRQELEQLPHGEEIVDHYRVQINKQEDEVLRRFLKS